MTSSGMRPKPKRKQYRRLWHRVVALGLVRCVGLEGLAQESWDRQCHTCDSFVPWALRVFEIARSAALKCIKRSATEINPCLQYEPARLQRARECAGNQRIKALELPSRNTCISTTLLKNNSVEMARPPCQK